MRDDNRLSILDAKDGSVVEIIATPMNLAPRELGTIGNGDFFAVCMDTKIYIWRANGLALMTMIDESNCFGYLLGLDDGNLAASGTDRVINIYYTASNDF
jgi:hypothetical protein